jgi:flagellar motor switch protein FliN/FliY
MSNIRARRPQTRKNTSGLFIGTFWYFENGSERPRTPTSPYHGDLIPARHSPLMHNIGKNVATLDKVAVDITVVLGTTSMPIHQVLRLGRGAIIELDASEEDAVSILANNLPVAKGTVVVNGNRIAVNVAELLPRPPDMR